MPPGFERNWSCQNCHASCFEGRPTPSLPWWPPLIEVHAADVGLDRVKIGVGRRYAIWPIDCPIASLQGVGAGRSIGMASLPDEDI
jgi:hypothetical protein